MSSYPSMLRKQPFHRRKVCRFCADQLEVDYREAALLSPFLTDRAKIIPRRISGNCSKHQRYLTKAIKRARQIAILPYTDTTNE